MTQVKSRKTDFYRGSNVLRDYVLDNYIKGIYFDYTIKQNIPLNKGVNKYNVKITKQLQELCGEFKNIIMVYSIATMMMKEHKDYAYGEVKNLYRLMHAQSETIAFNRLLISKLRLYKVDKQQVYDSIKLDIKKQEDRIIRNKNLILETFKDFGMNNLTDLVQEDTGKDIFEHLRQFTDERISRITITTDEEADNFFKETKIAYIEWLKALANKYDISIYESVSEKIIQDRERRSRMAEQIRLDKQEKCKNRKRDNAIKVLDNDNICIQQDVDKAVDIIEYRLTPRKVNAVTLQHLVNRLVNQEHKIYYVACTSKTVVRYLDSKMDKTLSIAKAKFFNDINDANKFMNEAKSDIRLNGTYLKVEQITLGESIIRSGIYEKIDIAHRIQSLIENPEDKVDRIMALNMIYSANGFGSYDSNGKAIVYQHITGEAGVLCKETNGNLKISYDHTKMLVFKNPINLGLLGLEQNTFKPIMIKFNCPWYAKMICSVQREAKFIQARLTGSAKSSDYKKFELSEYEVERCTTLGDIATRYEDSIINRLQLNIKVHKLQKEAYYIHSICLDTVSYISLRSSKYIKMENKNGKTEMISTADLYGSFEEASKMVEYLYGRNRKYLYLIGKIDLTGVRQLI